MIKWIIVEQLATLIQCFISTDFVTKYLGFKISATKKWMGFIAAFLAQVGATLAMNQITVFEGIAGIIYPSIVIIYALLFLNGSIYEKIVIACIDNVLKMITGISVLTIISYLSPYEVTNLIIMRGVERFIVLVMAMCSYFFCTRMILRLQRDNKFSLTITEWVTIFCVFITSFAAGVLVFEILLTSPHTQLNYFYAVMIMLCLIIINVLCYYVFVKMSAKNKERLQYTLMELRLKEQEKSLVEMKRSYEEIRKIRHDMKNYVECAATLLHSGKNDEAKNYLSSLLENKINVGNQIIYTDNDALNAVISSKMRLCHKNNIKFNYEITGSVKKIPELDISILMANLLDNAIEASMKLKEDRVVFLKIFNQGNYVVIQINNHIDQSVLDKNPGLMTTKKDKFQHGIGSISIKDIVKKHNGIMSTYEKDCFFCVDIWLNLGTEDD